MTEKEDKVDLQDSDKRDKTDGSVKKKAVLST
jgi:hypothetical protein